MDLSTSVFVYIGSIVLYKRIVNANTQSIRIANADGQGTSLAFISFANLFKIRNIKTLSLLKRDENFFQEKSSEGVLKSFVEQKSMR